MNESAILTFESLQIDPVHRRLVLSGEPVRLTAKPFDALLFLVENRGRVVTRDELRGSVWGGPHVTDAAIEQAISKIRKAVGDRGEAPHFVHTISGKGYLFSSLADGSDRATSDGGHVLPVPPIDSDAVPLLTPQILAARDSSAAISSAAAPIWYLMSASALYASLYSVAILAEAANAFDRFGAAASAGAKEVFPVVFVVSLTALLVHRRWTRKGRQGGLLILALIFFGSAAGSFLVAARALPTTSITMLSFQGFTARSAYLKDVSYFLILAVCLLLMPYHFVCRLEYEVGQGRLDTARSIFGNRSVRGLSWLVKPKPGLLLGMLLGALVWSLLSVARIIENLKPGPFLDLYINLLQIQRFAFFALGFQCLAWYYFRLRELEQVLAD